MKSFDLPDLAEKLLPAVLAAGAAEMRYYENGVVVEEKADSSPVTAADRAAEAILLDGLWHAARGVPVVAEECMAAGELPPRSTTFFLIDPLDGTREFANGTGEFTVNIGLVAGREPVFGMIYAPALRALYITLSRNHAVEAMIPVGAKPSLAGCPLRKLRTRVPDIDALTALEGRSQRTAEAEAFFAGLAIAEVRRAGSSLKFCHIARGDADVYARLGPTKEWDTAAGQAILEASGGKVTTLDGEALTYGKADDDYYNPRFVAWGREPIAPRVNSFA